MHNRFTQAEIEELVDSVKKNPENLQEVFRKLSEKWGTHPPRSISLFYYRKVKNTQQCFLTIGEKKAFMNRKIVSSNTITPMEIRDNVWTKIKRFFKL